MTPSEAAQAIREAAAAFAAGNITVKDFWGAFHEHLPDLCAVDPLDGDWLATFEALEAWEASVGSDRSQAVEALRPLARRLAA